VLSRIIYGARVSLVVGLASVIIGTVLGTVARLASGYGEGTLDIPDSA
jgi:peptide/nickel transport system permease protein